MIILKSEREIGYMREAGRVVAETHREVAKAVAADVTPKIGSGMENYLSPGATASFKGYIFPSISLQ